MLGGEQSLEMRVRQRRVVGQAAPHRKRIPLLLHDQRPSARCWVTIEKLAPPTVAIRPHVETSALVTRRHVEDVFAGVSGIAKTEGVEVIIAHGEPGAVTFGNAIKQRLNEGGLRDRIHVSHTVFETEVKGARVVFEGV